MRFAPGSDDTPREGPKGALFYTMPFVFALARILEARIHRLSSVRARALVLAAAVLLAAPSVGPHRALDDWVLGLIAQRRGAAVGLDRGPLDLFTFTTGNAADNHRLMDVGLMLPWWTDPRLKIAFFRPVASLTHWVDERLFPGSAVLMHVHSLVWFAALLSAVLLVYRRLETSAVLSGLSFFFYALDDAHAAALSWLANRNALIAAVFGCLTLVAHDAWRRHQGPGRALAAVGLWGLALLSGESAIGAFAYLLAYAVFLENGPLRTRALSVAPYAFVLAVWRVLWGRTYGAFGSGAYIDPGADPASFLAVLPTRLAVLLHAQFSAPPADVAFLGPPAHQPLVHLVAFATVAVVGWLLVPVVREDRVSRFWATGMLLATVPLVSTFPSDRLLLFTGIGGMALLSRLVHGVIARVAAGRDAGRARSVLTFALAGFHGLAAPLILPARSAQMELFGRAHDRAAQGIPAKPGVASRTVVVISAPVVLFANYLQAEREYEGVPRPAHVYLLSDASSAVQVTRTGGAELSLRPRQGFLYTPLERHYRAAPLPVGTEARLSAMTARIVSARPDGRPDRVTFDFERPADEYDFVTWKNGRFVTFELPRAGESVELPEEDFGKVLLASTLSGAE